MSEIVVGKSTMSNKWKRSTKERQKWFRKRWRRKKLQFHSLLSWTTFHMQNFPLLRWYKQSTNLKIIWTLWSQVLYIQEFQRIHLWIQRCLTIRDLPVAIMEALLSEIFPQGDWNCLVDPMASCCLEKLCVDFFSTFELLYQNIRIRLQTIRARPNFLMISDNPNIRLRIIDVTLYVRCIAFKDEYHNRRTDKFAYTHVDINYWETLAKVFILPAQKIQGFKENTSKNTPVRRIVFAMNTSSAFIGSYTENPSWYRKFDLSYIRTFRIVQSTVVFDAADNCRLYVTTIKARNFQDDMLSILIDIFKNHHVLMFDLT